MFLGIVEAVSDLVIVISRATAWKGVCQANWIYF